MGDPRPQIVCAVEDGWWGTRAFSLAAIREGFETTVLIRDALEPEVLAMITIPPRMRLTAVGRAWFRWRLLGEVLRAAARGPLRWVVITKPRTRRFIAPVARLCRARILQMVETVDGYSVEGAPAGTAPPFFHGTVPATT
jgi:hypothetical protein